MSSTQSQQSDLWATRKQAEKAVVGSLKHGADCIQKAFTLLNECLEQLGTVDTAYTRICSIACKKGRREALGCYSLVLDGLAQEAGALLRVLIETTEQLRYFREDPTRVSQAESGKMPPAGEIAQKIQGDFKALRDALNEDASHFGFSEESTRHIKDFQDHSLTTYEGEAPLQKNLRMLFIFMMFLTKETAQCLEKANIPPNQLLEQIDDCALMGVEAFGIQVP